MRRSGGAPAERAFESLEAIGGTAPVAHMEGHYGYGRTVLAGLVDRGLARISLEAVSRDPFAGEGDDVELPRHLNSKQTEVLTGLTELTRRPDPGVALLRGVTGSGRRSSTCA